MGLVALTDRSDNHVIAGPTLSLQAGRRSEDPRWVSVTNILVVRVCVRLDMVLLRSPSRTDDPASVVARDVAVQVAVRLGWQMTFFPTHRLDFGSLFATLNLLRFTLG